MDILDDIGVSKLSAKVFFFKVNYSFKKTGPVSSHTLLNPQLLMWKK